MDTKNLAALATQLVDPLLEVADAKIKEWQDGVGSAEDAAFILNLIAQIEKLPELD